MQLQENPRRRRRTRRRRKSYAANTMLQQNAGMRFADRALLENPYDGMLQENQTFSVGAVRAFGMAGLGVGLGLVVADMADRFVATRKPTNGKNPYYGANAAAAQNRRPDAWRLGAQAAGGVVGVGLAYAVRGRAILPFLVGGIAVGFFANLTKLLLNWYAMPMAFKVQSGAEATFANRMYPLEQKSVQDTVDSLFENWATTVNLNLNQQDPPQIVGVSPVPTTGPAYTLGRRGNGVHQGKARAQSAEASGRVGQPTLVPTGRLGMCSSCGGNGGCWDHCPELVTCGDCTDELIARRCEYEVQAGDDLAAMAAQHGIDVAQVDALNAPGYWAVGNKVILPYAFCRALESTPVAPPVVTPSTAPCPPGTYLDVLTGRCLSLIRGVPGLAGAPNNSETVMPFGLTALPED